MVSGVLPVITAWQASSISVRFAAFLAGGLVSAAVY